MASITDCAVFSEHCYPSPEVSLSSGWEVIRPYNGSGGFAATLYGRGNERVLAFRGTETDVPDDLLADLHMIPLASAAQTASVPPALMRAYGLQDNTELALGGLILTNVMHYNWAQNQIAGAANQIPPVQSRHAVETFDSISPAPNFVCGHSLGGALAKIVCQQRGVACIAFNSPYMGDLQGMEPQSNSNMLSINAIGDPLSVATRQIGNLGHGEAIDVRVADYPHPPPERPTLTTYSRPVSCIRRTDSAFSRAATALCEDVLENIVDPIGRGLTTLQRATEIAEHYPTYYLALLDHCGSVALHYHGMKTLRTAVADLGGRFSSNR